MRLTTSRLLLRDGTPDDAEKRAAAIGHWDVVRMLERVPWPYGFENARWWLGLPKPVDRPEPLIVRRDTGAVVGGVALVQKDGPELGYWIAPAEQGCGFATEAGRAMLAHGQDDLKFDRIVSGHFADNPASGQVLAKIGFRRLGPDGTRPCLARGASVGFVGYDWRREDGQC